MNLFRLVYCSRASGRFGYAQLTELLNTSRRRNEGRGLSGMLCHAPPFFFQCLEGPRSVVNLTMTRIFRDVRHTDIVILDARLVPGRMFPDWAMQLVELDDLPDGLLQKLLHESISIESGKRREADRLLTFLEQLSQDVADSPARSREIAPVE